MEYRAVETVDKAQRWLRNNFHQHQKGSSATSIDGPIKSCSESDLLPNDTPASSSVPRLRLRGHSHRQKVKGEVSLV
jgi:hypothetical protein